MCALLAWRFKLKWCMVGLHAELPAKSVDFRLSIPSWFSWLNFGFLSTFVPKEVAFDSLMPLACHCSANLAGLKHPEVCVATAYVYTTNTSLKLAAANTYSLHNRNFRVLKGCSKALFPLDNISCRLPCQVRQRCRHRSVVINKRAIKSRETLEWANVWLGSGSKKLWWHLPSLDQVSSLSFQVSSPHCQRKSPIHFFAAFQGGSS